MEKLGDGQPKPQGTWDYYGSADPAHAAHGHLGMVQTFSVGIFQWWDKAMGTGTKRLPSVRRFSGPISKPGEVYKKAISFIDKLEFLERGE